LLEQSRSPNEALISAFAALAADYKDVPVTAQQQLSAKLIADIRSGIDEAPLAIRVLGNARITQALPKLVSVLSWKESFSATTEAAVDAIIMFGNLALPEIKKLGEGNYPGGLISILQAINTGPAARHLIEMFEVRKPARHYLISHALSAMMRSDRIVDDLLDLERGVLPLDLRPFAAGPRNGWKYARPASAEFLRLEQYLQSCMWLRIDERDQGTLRINLPALLNEGRRRDVSRSYRRCGFDDVPRVERLVREVATAARRNEIDLWRTLERADTVKVVSDVDERSLVSIQRMVVPGLVLLHWINVLDLLLSPSRVSGSATNDLRTYAMNVLLLLWSVAITFAAVWWRRRDGWSPQLLGAALSPYPVFLRRLPSMMPRRPWLSFALFGFLAAGVLFTRVRLSLYPMESLALGIAACVSLLVFMAIYYRVVLRTDPLLQLILLHPEGRELLRRG